MKTLSTSMLPCLLLAISSLSCGPSGPKLHPVRGKVLFNDEPAVGATVVFRPSESRESTTPPSGVVGDDGSFALVTHPFGNGAKAGEYTVTISWFGEDARQQENAKSKLPKRYADPEKTPIPKVTIKEGNNELPPFQLTGKMGKGGKLSKSEE